MQVGEPLTATLTSLPPDKELAAELVSVTFKSPIAVSRGKATIEGPHWQRGSDTEAADEWSGTAAKFRLQKEPYAKRAAAYVVAGGGSDHRVEVKVRVTRNQNISSEAKLSGNLRGLTIEGQCPTGQGEHTVPATITNPPEGIAVFRGEIAWGLSVDEEAISLSLGKSLAEIYFILGTPKAPFAEEGVWVEALRFISQRVGVSGERDPHDAAAKITAYCHSGHGLRYETRNGRPQYGAGHHGGGFRLTAYMSLRKERCNCYDQAAAIQALAAAIGVNVAWCYLSPFGFIKLTHLVGVGLTNNPFFKSDQSKKVLPFDAPERTAFGNHAFISDASEVAFDSCAGPHVGEETLFQYLSASIDDTPALYSNRFRPGRVGDIAPGEGIVRIT
jgi:hypothetical protein